MTTVRANAISTWKLLTACIGDIFRGKETILPGDGPIQSIVVVVVDTVAAAVSPCSQSTRIEFRRPQIKSTVQRVTA
jgi:hypothetical protein